MTIELLGYVGSVCLAACAAPEAWKCWRTKEPSGASRGLLVLWSAGELCTFAYVLPKADVPLLLNYGSNIVFLSVVWYYSFRRRK